MSELLKTIYEDKYELLKTIYEKYQICRKELLIFPYAGDYEKSEFLECAILLTHQIQYRYNLEYRPGYVLIIFGSGDNVKTGHEICTALYAPIEELKTILMATLYDEDTATDICNNFVKMDVGKNSMFVFSMTLKFDNCSCLFSVLT